MPRMRAEFATRFGAFRERIFHEDYMQKYPREVVRLTSEEMRARSKAAQDWIVRLIDSGWRPANSTYVQKVYTDCFTASDFREDPFSDLRDVAAGAYRDIGQPTPSGQRTPLELLGEAQAQAAQEAVSNLEAHLMAKIPATDDPRHDFRKRLLAATEERLHASRGEPVHVQDLRESLKMPNDRDTLSSIADGLRYWIDRGALNARDGGNSEDGVPLIVVLRLTALGHDIVEDRLAVHPPSTIVHAETVGIVGTMTGGVVNQNVGAGFADLLAALERFRAAAVEEPSDTAAVIESAASEVVRRLQAQHSDRNQIQRVLNGIAATVQTVGALGPAWTLVATEAAKVGIQIMAVPGTH